MTVKAATLLNSGFSFPGGPIAYPDSIMNAGTKLLYDFTNDYCWDPDNAVINGATLTNLVDGTQSAKLNIAGGGVVSFANGFTFDNSHSNIALDDGTEYLTAGDGPDRLLWVWAKVPNTESSTSCDLFAKRSGNNSAAGFILGFCNGASPSSEYAKLSAYASGYDLQQTYSDAGGAVHLFAVSVIGGVVTNYRDNLAIASVSGHAAFVTNSNPLVLGWSGIGGSLGAVNAKYFRCGYEDLTISGNNTAQKALAQIQAEYALNMGLFS